MLWAGLKTGVFGSNSIGIVVLSVGENLKFVNNLINPIFVCMRPKRRPMH